MQIEPQDIDTMHEAKASSLRNLRVHLRDLMFESNHSRQPLPASQAPLAQRQAMIAR